MGDGDRDRAAVAALVHAYAERLDGGDLDGVADLFAAATWRSGAGTVRRGRDEVRAVYDGVQLYDGVPRTKHLITNLVVELGPGPNEAGARCTFTVLQGVTPGAPLCLVLAGRYQDRFTRGPGGWAFNDRLILPDLLGDGSRHFR